MTSGSQFVLGISAYYHDAAACLIKDGRIVGAAQEERFTRIKHDASFPRHAIDYCLHRAPHLITGAAGHRVNCRLAEAGADTAA